MVNKEIGLQIYIDDDMLENILNIGKEHYPNEFGGFLIGNYSDDFKLLNITDTILPIKYKSTKHLFERDNIGIEEKLYSFFNSNPKKYYVGEWHTHPDNLPIPSKTDIEAMNIIVNHSEVFIKNPVLLIIGYKKNESEFAFYVQFKNKLYKYEKIKE